MTNAVDVFIVPNPADRAMLLNAVPRIYFPWEKLLPDLQRQGKAGFTVEFADLSAFTQAGHTFVATAQRQAFAQDDHGHGAHVLYGDRVPGLPQESARAAWGLFWFDGRIQIEQTLRGQQANIDWVLSAEIAHAIDVFYMQSRGMREPINRLVHGGSTDAHPWFGGPYWEQTGEGWMSGCGLAYTDFVDEDPRFLHRFTRAMVPQIRSILQAPRTDEVAPPPPPLGVDWTLVSDEAFTAEYLRRFGDWSGIDIALTHRKGVVWRRSWRD